MLPTMDEKENAAPTSSNETLGDLLYGLAVVIGVPAGAAVAVSVLRGSSSVLWAGLILLAVGLVCFLVFLSPYLERDWPFDGKDGWLWSGMYLAFVGVAVSAIGLLLRL